MFRRCRVRFFIPPPSALPQRSLRFFLGWNESWCRANKIIYYTDCWLIWYKYVCTSCISICGYECIHMRVCKNVKVITPAFIGSLSVMASSKNNFLCSHNFRPYRSCKGSVLSLLQLFNTTLCLHVWHIYQQIHWAENGIVIWQLKVPYTEHIWVRDGRGFHSTSQNSREEMWRKSSENHLFPVHETIIFPTFPVSTPPFSQIHPQKTGRFIAKGLLPVGRGDLQPSDAALALPLYPYGTLAQRENMENGRGDTANFWPLGYIQILCMHIIYIYMCVCLFLKPNADICI